MFACLNWWLESNASLACRALINFEHRLSLTPARAASRSSPNPSPPCLLVITSLSRSLIITTSRSDYSCGRMMYELSWATRHNTQQVCQDEHIMKRHTRSPQVTGNIGPYMLLKCCDSDTTRFRGRKKQRVGFMSSRTPKAIVALTAFVRHHGRFMRLRAKAWNLLPSPSSPYANIGVTFLPT